MKGVNQGLSSLKSLAKERERAHENINQILFPIIFPIGTEKDNTLTHKPDTVFLKSVAGRKVPAYIEGKF